MTLIDLEQQQADLAEVQLSDFRAASLFEWVASRIPKGGSVLDVGCGASGLVAYLLEAGFNVRGIDTSDTIIQSARAFLSGRNLDPGRISVGMTSDLIAAGTQVDTIVCMDCLEHVEDDQMLFDELVTLTRPGGTLLVTVPALMGLYGERDEKIGHYRRYERKDLATLAEGMPLKIHELRFWNIIGVLPTYISQKVLGRNVEVGFRYGTPSFRKHLMRSLLHTWFRHIENSIPSPIGMSLLLHATRDP